MIVIWLLAISCYICRNTLCVKKFCECGSCIVNSFVNCQQHCSNTVLFRSLKSNDDHTNPDPETVSNQPIQLNEIETKVDKNPDKITSTSKSVLKNLISE